MTEVRPPAYPPADSELTVAILYKDEQASNNEQLKKGPNEATNSLNSGRELGTLFNQMAIGECRDEIVSTFQSSKGAVSSINRNTTNTENDHDIHYMDGYINENEDAEIQRELGQAVLKAATDTALATQNIEGADGRRKVAHLCQDQKNFSRNELTLRKWLQFDPSLATCRADNLQNLGQDGHTPLHIAAKSNNLEAMKILLENEEVSTWTVDLQGRTPLHIAAGNGHLESCIFLREKMQLESGGRRDPIGANAPLDLSGTTPVGWAAVCSKGNPSPMIKRTLFKVGDKTVLPLTPIRLRAGASPRRTVDRVRAYAGIVNNQDVGVGVNVRDEEKDDIVFAFSLAKGWKAEMEDKVVAVPTVSGRPLWSFFGVCDGHGGDYVASYLEKHLPNIVAQVAKQHESSSSSSSSSFRPTVTSRSETTSSVESDENTSPEDLKEVLRTVCSVADYNISKQKRMAVDKNESTGELSCKDSSGSTGVFCLISKSLIAVANVGDSRALLAQWCAQPSGLGDIEHSSQFSETPARLFAGEIESENIPKGVLIASALSVDHKFCIGAERERADAAGAIVAVVQGEGVDPNAPQEFEVSTLNFKRGSKKLRMSRSFGDFYLKQNDSLPPDQQAVCAVPDVVVCARSSSDVFVLLACDGVYDVMENQEIVDILSYKLGYTGAGGPIGGPTMARCAAACDYLLLKCVELGAHDNLSAVVIMCGEATGSAVSTNVSSDVARTPSMDMHGGFGISDGMLSPEPSSSLFLGSPTSGARDISFTDRAPAGTYSTDSPFDKSCDEEESHRDRNINVNRHLEFSKESQ